MANALSGAPLKYRKNALGDYRAVGNGRSPMSAVNALQALSMIPGVGDIIGPVADAAMYYDKPETRTPGNFALSGLGLLPFVPGITAYHGTGASRWTDGLDPRKLKAGDNSVTLGGFRKYGVSVSPDPKVASRFAMDFHPSDAVVMPLDVNIKNPLKLSAVDFERLQSLTSKIDSGELLTESEDITLELLLKKHGLQHGHPIESIKSGGFDAIEKIPREGTLAEPEILVFDPKKIKGIFQK